MFGAYPDTKALHICLQTDSVIDKSLNEEKLGFSKLIYSKHFCFHFGTYCKVDLKYGLNNSE